MKKINPNKAYKFLLIWAKIMFILSVLYLIIMLFYITNLLIN